MKKAFLLMSLPVLYAGLMFAVINRPTYVSLRAEGEETSEPATSSSEQEQEEKQETEVDEEKEKETIVNEVKGWLSQHFDKQMVANIITWASEAGVLGALLGVYIKYRKYKATSLEDLLKLFKVEMKKYFAEEFKKLSDEQIQKLVNGLNNVEKAEETIMKVLVLMQDTSSKGKVALLDFLGSKTNSEEVKEAANEVQKDLEDDMKNDDAVNEAVKGEYEDIF